MKIARLAALVGSLAIALNTSAPAFAESSDQQTTSASDSRQQASHRPVVGLALGGGGARGAALAGVLKVLVEEGVPIDIVAGTSIGSVVGGMYCAGLSPDECAKKFKDSELVDAFMPMALPTRMLLAPIIFLPRLVGYHPYDGLYKGKKFEKWVNGLVGEQHRDIEKLPVRYAAVCTNLVDGLSYPITKGSLAAAMDASSAVPGLRKPVEIDNNLYCDGGVVCNLPVKHVRDMGADFVIAVDIDEHLKSVPLDSFRKVGSVSKQALRIQLANVDRSPAKNADIVIHPATDGISLISRSTQDGARGVEAGIKAAREAMPEIKRKLAAIGVMTASKSQSLSER